MTRRQRVELAAGRAAWLEQLDVLTHLHRHKKAEKLDKRGAELARERFRRWQRGEELSELDRDRMRESFERAARAEPDPDARTALLGLAAELDANRLPAYYAARSQSGRPQREPPLDSRWHSSRAEGQRGRFERVRACELEQRVLRIACRDCGYTPENPVPIGCCAVHFCPECRAQIAQRFRVDFERKRLGLVNTARRAGLMDRFRRRSEGGRFGERLITLTPPHWGSPVERVQAVRAAWPRFWRLVSDELRERLASLAAGILTVDPARADRETGELLELHRKSNGRRKRDEVRPVEELSLWDVVSYLWVFEWTPGKDDGAGHPHIHAWLFSPFIPHELLQRFWTQALASVTGHRARRTSVFRKGVELERWTLQRAEHTDDGSEFIGPRLERMPLVDVRTAADIEKHGGDVASELVKYLLKDWEIGEGGAKRAAPEVFAQVYASIDGLRARQSSAGLQNWAIGKHVACPCCGYENERGHWAHTSVVFVPQQQGGANDATAPAATGPPPVSGGESWSEWVLRALDPDDPRAEAIRHRLEQPDGGREAELRAEYWAERDRQWADSLELRVLRANWARGIHEQGGAETSPLAKAKSAARARRGIMGT